MCKPMTDSQWFWHNVRWYALIFVCFPVFTVATMITWGNWMGVL